MSFGAPSIVDSVEIAYGVTPQGVEFQVFHVKYDKKIRGKYDESTVVQFSDINGVTRSAAFLNWKDAKAFLTGNGDVEFTAYNDNGEEYKDTRTGCRIPPALIVETLKVETPTGPSGTTGVTGGPARNH